MGYASLEYYGLNGTGSPNVSQSATLNLTYYLPFLVTESANFDRISCVSGTVSSSPIFRLGIYNNSGGKPSTVLLDAGTITATSSNTTFQITINETLAAGWYWLAVTRQSGTGTQQLVGFQAGVLTTFPARYNADGYTGRGPVWTQTGVTGAYATASTDGSNNQPPSVMLRKS
jgi:hypothetical protein